MQGVAPSGELRPLRACPVCAEARWQRVGQYSYRRADQGRADIDEYARLRRRVLFEVWMPGSDEVELSAELCGACGFVAYSPRPTDSAVDAKYRFLNEHEPSIGGSASSELGRRMDARRAQRIIREVAPGLRPPKPRVLDFGGGDGKLLAPFIAAGAQCAIVDYNPQPLPGVTRVGATLDALAASERFDVILCNHVLEHVADPAGIVQRLRAHLTPTGVLYAEVPVEVWRGIPIRDDPVTHINFFTLGSFEQLFVRHGYEVLSASERCGSYGEAIIDVAVVVARAGAGRAREMNPASAARRRLEPGRIDALRRVGRFANRSATQIASGIRAGGIRPALRIVARRSVRRLKARLR